MKKYRIGRIHEPWTNLEPPIRSPDFYENIATRKDERTTETLEKDWEKHIHSRASADLSPVRLLYNNTTLSGACIVSLC